MEKHIKTRYTKKGDPPNRTKGHVGDHIKFIKENAYHISVGTEAKIVSVIKSKNVIYEIIDWHYKIKLPNRKTEYIMAAPTWEIIRR